MLSLYQAQAVSAAELPLPPLRCRCLRRHAAAAAELPLPPTSRCRATGLLLNIRPPLSPLRCHCRRRHCAATSSAAPTGHRLHIPILLLNIIIAPPPFCPRLVIKCSISASSHPFPTKPSAHSVAHDVSNKFNEPEHVWAGHRRRFAATAGDAHGFRVVLSLSLFWSRARLFFFTSTYLL